MLKRHKSIATFPNELNGLERMRRSRHACGPGRRVAGRMRPADRVFEIPVWGGKSREALATHATLDVVRFQMVPRRSQVGHGKSTQHRPWLMESNARDCFHRRSFSFSKISLPRITNDWIFRPYRWHMLRDPPIIYDAVNRLINASAADVRNAAKGRKLSLEAEASFQYAFPPVSVV